MTTTFYLEISNKNKTKFLNIPQAQSNINLLSFLTETTIDIPLQDFLSKYLPSFTSKKDTFFTTSKSISKHLLKIQYISKPEVEKAVNHFLNFNPSSFSFHLNKR